jgi:hypothetical protein
MLAVLRKESDSAATAIWHQSVDKSDNSPPQHNHQHAAALTTDMAIAGGGAGIVYAASVAFEQILCRSLLRTCHLPRLQAELPGRSADESP